MGNITKSILYSGTVLAAGMIAVFSIYSNMTGQAGIHTIEPAAGVESNMDANDAATMMYDDPAGSVATPEEMSAIETLIPATEDASTGMDIAGMGDMDNMNATMNAEQAGEIQFPQITDSEADTVAADAAATAEQMEAIMPAAGHNAEAAVVAPTAPAAEAANNAVGDIMGATH